MTGRKINPTWSDLKRQLADLDRPALLGLIQDIYAASKNNQAFLHARFALGEGVLEPYKATIDRWVCLDVMGWGVGDDMGDLMAEYGFTKE